jgi:hypothetical protein
MNDGQKDKIKQTNKQKNSQTTSILEQMKIVLCTHCNKCNSESGS